jgi:adenylate cyclase
VSSTFFSAAAKEDQDCLVSVGRYALRGVARPQELFTLDHSRIEEEDLERETTGDTKSHS